MTLSFLGHLTYLSDALYQIHNQVIHTVFPMRNTALHFLVNYFLLFAIKRQFDALHCIILFFSYFCICSTVNYRIEPGTLFRILNFGPGFYQNQDSIQFWEKNLNNSMYFIRKINTFPCLLFISTDYIKHIGNPLQFL